MENHRVAARVFGKRELAHGGGALVLVGGEQIVQSFVANPGVSHRTIREVFGVCKPIQTYVGAALFSIKDPMLDKAQRLGNEFGATTGRARQCRWMALNDLKNTITVNGITTLYVNKCDVFEEIGFKIALAYTPMSREHAGEPIGLREFETFEQWKAFLIAELAPLIPEERIHFTFTKRS